MNLLSELENSYSKAIKEKEELEEQVSICEKQLDRA
jgi:hypothetical protein